MNTWPPQSPFATHHVQMQQTEQFFEGRCRTRNTFSIRLLDECHFFLFMQFLLQSFWSTNTSRGKNITQDTLASGSSLSREDSSMVRNTNSGTSPKPEEENAPDTCTVNTPSALPSHAETLSINQEPGKKNETKPDDLLETAPADQRRRVSGLERAGSATAGTIIYFDSVIKLAESSCDVDTDSIRSIDPIFTRRESAAGESRSASWGLATQHLGFDLENTGGDLTQPPKHTSV